MCDQTLQGTGHTVLRTRRSQAGLRLGALLSSILCSAASAQTYSFHVTAIDQTHAVAINLHGATVGSIQGPATTGVWFGGSPVALKSPYGWGAAALAINDSGVVVGECYTNGVEMAHACLWSGTKVGIDLGTLAGASAASSAEAINDTGTIVGYSQDANANYRAVSWDGLHIHALEAVAGSFNTFANGINRAGVVVGHADTSFPFNFHAVEWTSQGATFLADDDALESHAYAINSSGTVVGEGLFTSQTSLNFWRAVVWRDGGLFKLGRLDPDSLSMALAINDAGIVVGWDGQSGQVERAVRWVHGVAEDLNTLVDQATRDAWMLQEASAINADGLIAGWAVSRIDGSTHAFVMAPSKTGVPPSRGPVQ